MVKPAAVTISTRLAADVAKAVAALGQVWKGGDPAIEEFRRAFAARWEDREIPLADALDEESGIGFEAARGPGSEGSPLLAGVGFPGAAGENRVAFGPATLYLLRRLGEALATGRDEIELTDKDLEQIKAEAPANLPEAFAMMLRFDTDSVL